MSGSGDQVENDFKIFPKLGTAKSEIFTTSWPTPAGTVEPVELSGIKLTPISKQETFHRYLEKYGVQQIFSNIIQDLYNEDPLPDVTLAKAYFMKKWLNILPCKAGSDTIDKEVEELQRKLVNIQTEKEELLLALQMKDLIV